MAPGPSCALVLLGWEGSRTELGRPGLVLAGQYRSSVTWVGALWGFGLSSWELKGSQSP